MRTPIALLICALAAAGSAAAQEESPEAKDEFVFAIVDVATSEDRCPDGGIIDVKFAALAANAERYVGKCVRTSGLVSGRAIDESIQFDATITCFCREARCDGKWPIANLDAANSPRRPYACFKFARTTVSGKTEEEIRTEMDWRDIPEPGRYE